MTNISFQHNLPNLGIQDTRTESSSASAAASGSASGTSNQVDAASVSTTASALTSLNASSDVRMDKVAAIRTQIEQGTYSVSTSDVADKLIDRMLE